MLIRVKNAEIAIGSANTVYDSTIVRVVNSGTAAVLNFAYANGEVYANTTVVSGEAVVVVKAPTDTLAGSGLKATPVDYRG